MKKLLSLFLSAGLVLSVAHSQALAQTAQGQQAQSGTQGAAKAKRPRSPAQLRNDQILRDCGKEWRADKAAGKTGTQTWISYSGACRKRKSA